MSIWSDIQDRGSGEVLRKEEEFSAPSPIDAAELEKMLRDGIVHFQYRKKPKKGQNPEDAPIRDAWGTKKMDFVEKIPHGGDCPPKRAGYTIYFDVEKGDWRAYWDGNVIGAWKKVYTFDEFERVYTQLYK